MLSRGRLSEVVQCQVADTGHRLFRLGVAGGRVAGVDDDDAVPEYCSDLDEDAVLGGCDVQEALDGLGQNIVQVDSDLGAAELVGDLAKGDPGKLLGHEDGDLVDEVAVQLFSSGPGGRRGARGLHRLGLLGSAGWLGPFSPMQFEAQAEKVEE